MKKILCLCLMLSLLVACSSEKDTKPNPAAAPAVETAAAPSAPEPITSLSGEYVLTETESKKTKLGTEEITCTTTHTYTLVFISDTLVRYTAKTDQSMDPPADNMVCFAKLYNVDETATYEIKDGGIVTLTFSLSGGNLPWVSNNVMSLRIRDSNTLGIVKYDYVFRKQ